MKMKTELHNKLIDESLKICHSQGIDNAHLYITYNNSNSSNSDAKSTKIKRETASKPSGGGGGCIGGGGGSTQSEDIVSLSKSAQINHTHTIVPARNLLPNGFYNFVVSSHFI